MIISTDSLIAALLAAWVQIERMQPLFAAADEPLMTVIGSNRVDLCIVDVDHPDGASPEFVARARRAGLPVVLFSPGRTAQEVRERAALHDCTWFPLPGSRELFAQTLRRAAQQATRSE